MEHSEEEITLDTENVNDETINNDEIINTDEIVNNDETSENENIEDCIDVDEENIIENKFIVIENSKRISRNKMTRYEFVRIIGERTKQLTMGAKPLIKQSKLSEEFTYTEIAIEELKLNAIPFKIRRLVKDHYELWAIEELDKKHLETLYG